MTVIELIKELQELVEVYPDAEVRYYNDGWMDKVEHVCVVTTLKDKTEIHLD